jgi:hypothetical protein
MAKVSSKNAAVLINGSLFSTYATAYNIEKMVDPLDVTGFGDGSKNFIPGMLTGRMAVDMLWDTTATVGIHAKLSDAGQFGNVTIIPEGYALGADSISLPYTQATYAPQAAVTEAIKIGSIVFESYGNNFGAEFGKALYLGTITNTASSTAVDNGAATTGVFSAVLHVFTPPAADTYAIVVQHSTDGNTWATLATFTADGSAITSERQVGTSVNRYRRVTATRTGSAGNNFGFAVVLYSI